MCLDRLIVREYIGLLDPTMTYLSDGPLSDDMERRILQVGVRLVSRNNEKKFLARGVVMFPLKEKLIS